MRRRDEAPDLDDVDVLGDPGSVLQRLDEIVLAARLPVAQSLNNLSQSNDNSHDTTQYIIVRETDRLCKV